MQQKTITVVIDQNGDSSVDFSRVQISCLSNFPTLKTLGTTRL